MFSWFIFLVPSVNILEIWKFTANGLTLLGTWPFGLYSLPCLLSFPFLCQVLTGTSSEGLNSS